MIFDDVDVEENVDSDLEELTVAKNEFFESMDDDFNTPKAIASIFKFITALRNKSAHGNLKLNTNDKIAIKSFLDDASYIFGVSFKKDEIDASSDDLFVLISQIRSDLRANKQYDLSDKIRSDLQDLGYEIND